MGLRFSCFNHNYKHDSDKNQLSICDNVRHKERQLHYKETGAVQDCYLLTGRWQLMWVFGQHSEVINYGL